LETASRAELDTKGVTITEVTPESDTLASVNVGGSKGAGVNAGAASDTFVRVSELSPGSRAGINGISGADGLAGGVFTLHTIDRDVNDVALLLRRDNANSGLFRVRLLLMEEGAHGFADTAPIALCRVKN